MKRIFENKQTSKWVIIDPEFWIMEFPEYWIVYKRNETDDKTFDFVKLYKKSEYDFYLTEE